MCLYDYVIPSLVYLSRCGLSSVTAAVPEVWPNPLLFSKSTNPTTTIVKTTRERMPRAIHSPVKDVPTLSLTPGVGHGGCVAVLSADAVATPSL